MTSIKYFLYSSTSLNRSFYNKLLSNFILSLFSNTIQYVILNFFVLNIGIFSFLNFLNFFNFLKVSSFFQLKIITDLTVIDYPFNLLTRFKLIYSFLSTDFSSRLNLIFFLKEWDYFLSMTSIFKSAEWVEREVWDLFGIWFFGNKNLRRILTDYIFKGFPLKKDFPLNGYIHVYYNYIAGFIVMSRTYSMQEYRVFNFKNPWIL